MTVSPEETVPTEKAAHEHHYDAEDDSAPELEFDQDVAPRPEEEIADELRSQPDPHR
jgi:hypothetical protein